MVGVRGARLARTTGRWFFLSPPSTKQKPSQTAGLLLGGRGWIRTTEVVDNRFTVCSLWPLGNPSVCAPPPRGRGRMCVPFYTRDEVDGAGERNRTINLLITNQLLCLLSYTSRECFVPRHLSRGTVRRADGEGFVWCLGADLNHRHRDFQSLALPTELPRQAL